MKYAIGGFAILAAVGTAAYFYLQDKDADTVEPATAAPEEPTPETNI